MPNIIDGEKHIISRLHQVAALCQIGRDQGEKKILRGHHASPLSVNWGGKKKVVLPPVSVKAGKGKNCNHFSLKKRRRGGGKRSR